MLHRVKTTQCVASFDVGLGSTKSMVEVHFVVGLLDLSWFGVGLVGLM